MNMRITSKGQVTIPMNIREKYGLLPHSEVVFVEAKGKVYLEPANTKPNNQTRGRSLIAHLRGTATVRMTTDEIMRLTRGEK
jgi:AbrB family looped-hinge helix DNA binding protein